LPGRLESWGRVVWNLQKKETEKAMEPKKEKIKVASKRTAGNELSRVYSYPKAKGVAPIKIELPSTIKEGPGGAHIVLNCKGQSQFVPGGFDKVTPVYRPGFEASKANEDPKV